MARSERQEWQRQVLEVVDRSLVTAYKIDPLLYAELLKLRRRLARQALATARAQSRAA